jgi:hypothetical protein
MMKINDICVLVKSECGHLAVGLTVGSLAMCGPGNASLRLARQVLPFFSFLVCFNFRGMHRAADRLAF